MTDHDPYTPTTEPTTEQPTIEQSQMMERIQSKRQFALIVILALLFGFTVTTAIIYLAHHPEIIIVPPHE